MLLSCVQGVSASEGLGAEITYAKGGADAIVSLTYDDGYYATASFLNNQFKQKNLTGSLFLITDRLADDSYAGTLDEWKALFADGYLEPLSHSASHLYFAPEGDDRYTQYEKNNTAENYQHEITDSKQTLIDSFGYTPLSMAPGGGLMSKDGFEVVKKDYYSARLTNSIGNSVKGDAVSMQTLDPESGTDVGQWYNLKCLSVYLSGSAKRAEVLRDYVDTAVAQKGWFISYCHGICETGANEKANNMTTDDAEDYFTYIAEMQKAGKVWCAGISEATKYIRERQSSTVTETGDSSIIL